MGSLYHHENNELSTEMKPTESAVQKVTTKSLQAWITLQLYCRTLDGYPGEIRVYDKMSKELYREHIYNEV